MNKLLLLLLPFSVLASDDCFFDQKIRYTERNIEKLEQISFCKIGGSFYHPSCKEKNCLAKNANFQKGFNRKAVMGRIGNPLYKVCYHLKGIPKSLELKINGKWNSQVFCEFSDQSFVDVGTLWQKFRQHEKLQVKK